jgi:hypothetical protein
MARVAVAVCRFCSVALCKEHLVDAYQWPTIPQYGCDHHPERPFPPVATALATRATPSVRAA